YAKRFNPTTTYVVWDKRISNNTANFRKELSADVGYKDNRDSDKHDALFESMDDVAPILGSLGIRNMFPYSLEGDDVIAWITYNVSDKSTIVSGDGDMWQLVNDNCQVFATHKKAVITK